MENGLCEKIRGGGKKKEFLGKKKEERGKKEAGFVLAALAYSSF